MRLAGLVILSALAACGPHVERCGGPVLPIGCQAGGGGDGGLAGLADRLEMTPDRIGVAAEPEHDDHYEGPDLDGGYEDEREEHDGQDHDDDEREEEDEHDRKSERHRGSGRGASEESGERGADAMGRS